MKTLKIGVMLLAFLLAAVTMVPMVSAGNSDILSGSLKNQTMTISGITLPVVNSTSHSFDYTKFNTPLSREQFIAQNQKYIDYLAQKIGYDAALKIENDEYTQLTSPKKSLMRAAVSPTIQQEWGYDIYLWPYESKIQSTTDQNALPITFVVMGSTKSQLKNYLWNHGWNSAIGDAEYGLSGASLTSLSWDYVGNEDGLEQGNALSYRYHCLIHSGTYSQSLGGYWCFGECHYEHWNGHGHDILTNGYDLGENQIYSSLTSSGYTAYWNSLNNAVSGIFNGMGHVYTI